MKTEQQKQAETLYFQTSLSKTEIAEAVGVSRRTLHYWVQQNNWDAIRQASCAMPSFLAGNCYLILAQLQNSILSRTDAPVTMPEVNAIYKLATTISKLNAKGALSEQLEALTHFMEFTERFDPALAGALQPVLSAYAGHSAAPQQVGFTSPPPQQSAEEHQLDLRDQAAWQEELASTKSSAPSPAPVVSGSLHPSSAPARIPATPVTGNVSASTPVRPAAPLNRAARRAMVRAAA